MKYKGATVKKSATPTFPTRYGSHSSMINEDYKEYNNSGQFVVCTDERGDYITTWKSLDNGLCDYMRTETIEVRDQYFKDTLNDDA